MTDRHVFATYVRTDDWHGMKLCVARCRCGCGREIRFPENAKKALLENRILAVIDKLRDGVHLDALQERCAVSRGYLQKLLRRWVEEHRIERVERGCYRTTKEWRER